jgi:hypothetical protein
METCKKEKRNSDPSYLQDGGSTKEFHDSGWAGHRGVWATFAKLKEKY